MVEKFIPEINKVYFINQYTLILILAGRGGIQVDFRNYFDWEDKAIYLEKGQYIKFLSEDFEVRKIEFPNEAVFYNKEVRVLFKHLISLGYINFNECEACQRFLDQSVFSPHASDIIDISSQQWYWQNPFQANKEEYQVIFDLKEAIDDQFSAHLSNAGLVSLINERGYNVQTLVKDKVGISMKNLYVNKRLLESKKALAFSDKSVQEISYDLGYKDPAYFHRVFKKETGQSPKQFRENVDFVNRDVFSQHIIELLKTHHAQDRSLGFYADKMNLSVKALSKKVKDKLNTSLGQLIRWEMVHTAKKMLAEGASVRDTALYLGFEEANHFSHFFKHYTGDTPTGFKAKKYNL